MPELKPYRGDYYLWDYMPSLPASIVFTIIFIGLTGIHLWRMWKPRLWFASPFVAGGARE